jgi:hypothetical protein
MLLLGLVPHGAENQQADIRKAPQVIEFRICYLGSSKRSGRRSVFPNGSTNDGCFWAGGESKLHSLNWRKVMCSASCCNLESAQRIEKCIKIFYLENLAHFTDDVALVNIHDVHLIE